MSDLKFWHLQLVFALGGKCSSCGSADLNDLEIHCTTGDHKGYGNRQRQVDILNYKRFRIVPKGRILLCEDCHTVEHGSVYTKVGDQIKQELKRLGVK